MSRADERRAEQDRYLQSDASNGRSVEQLAGFDPDPLSWESYCAGNRARLHIRGRVLEDGRWQCASCFQKLRPRLAGTR